MHEGRFQKSTNRQIMILMFPFFCHRIEKTTKKKNLGNSVIFQRISESRFWFVAVPAVYRPSFSWFERYLAGLAAFGTGRIIHLPISAFISHFISPFICRDDPSPGSITDCSENARDLLSECKMHDKKRIIIR